MRQTFQIDMKTFYDQFIKGATGNPQDAKDFFDLFSFNRDLSEGNIINARIQILELLHKMQRLSDEHYQKIHKGALFYYLAIISFVIDNYSEASFYFDAAASEDMKNDPSLVTPSYLFMTLNSESHDQAAFKLTEWTSKNLSHYIYRYSKVIGNIPIDLRQFRTAFLSPSISTHKEWRTLVTSFITFLLEGDHIKSLHELRIEKGSNSLLLHHLVDGCLLLESLLKAAIRFRGLQISENTLGSILRTQTIKDLLGISKPLATSKLTIQDIKADLQKGIPSCEESLLVIARLRNVVEHDLIDSSEFSQEFTTGEFLLLHDAIIISCIHIVTVFFHKNECDKHEE